MCRHPGEEIAMNRRIRFAACLFAACTAPAFAPGRRDHVAVGPGHRVRRRWLPPRLPTQRQVGEWTGLHDFGRISAARERPVAGIGRAGRGAASVACRS
jgi:hypothetical protein